MPDAAKSRIPAIVEKYESEMLSEWMRQQLTAYASADDRRRVLDAGYDVYLVKPVEPADLVAAVKRVVPRRPAARAQ